MEKIAEQSVSSETVSLETILKFLVGAKYDGLAQSFIVTLNETQRTAGTALLNELIVAREQVAKARTEEYRRLREGAGVAFAAEIKDWTNDQLITWYGNHGPSAQPFYPFGGEMDEYVQAVYKELFQTGRLPQDQHHNVQLKIQDKLDERFDPNRNWNI